LENICGQINVRTLKTISVTSIIINLINAKNIFVKNIIFIDMKLSMINILNENVFKVYHGTNQKFSKFSFKNASQGIIWFTDSIDSIKNQEHGGQGNKIIMTRYITINKPAGWVEYEKYGLQQLEDRGYDGVILPQENKTDYFVFSNKNISAKEPLNFIPKNN
jgi:hypothetical protein